jgi:hypothetical protein
MGDSSWVGRDFGGGIMGCRSFQGGGNGRRGYATGGRCTGLGFKVQVILVAIRTIEGHDALDRSARGLHHDAYQA